MRETFGAGGTGGCVAVIPARGGSKGIPRKNLVRLGGDPLIGRSVAIARAARLIDRVVVTTDDAEIAATAASYGADVVTRPAALADDTASSEAAIMHVLTSLWPDEIGQPRSTVFLQCTAPLTRPGDIDGTITTLLATNADACFAALRTHHFLWRVDPDGSASGINHDHTVPRQRRQDLQPQFLEAGSVYAMRTSGFRAAGRRFFGRTVLYEVQSPHWVEIDVPADLTVAAALTSAAAEAERCDRLPARIGAVVFDFDGVMTDNRVVQFASGDEAVLCHRGDGYGIERLRQLGIPMVILSKETNPIVAARARKLQLPCRYGIDDKGAALTAWCTEHGIALCDTVYLGNDLNDLPAMARAGCSVSPADGHPVVRRAAHIVLTASGGAGAVRELCELIIARGR